MQVLLWSRGLYHKKAFWYGEVQVLYVNNHQSKRLTKGSNIDRELLQRQTVKEDDILNCYD